MEFMHAFVVRHISGDFGIKWILKWPTVTEMVSLGAKVSMVLAAIRLEFVLIVIHC